MNNQHIESVVSAPSMLGAYLSRLLEESVPESLPEALLRDLDAPEEELEVPDRWQFE
jgi:hypothetical protein